MEEQSQLLLTDYQRNLSVLLTCCQIHFRPPDHYCDWLLTEKKMSMSSIWNCYSFFAYRSLQKVCLSNVYVYSSFSIGI
jgi:hypothetical protein